VAAASTWAVSPPRARIVSAIVRRDYAVTRSYRFALAFDLLLAVVDLCVYYYISKALPGATADLDGAPSYFAFVTVGLAVTVVIGSASAQLSQRVREEQLTGTLEALVTQPVKPSELAFGLGGLPFLLALVRAAIYLTVATALFGVSLADADWLGFVVVMLATGAALLGLGIALGAVVLVIKRGTVAVTLATFALGLLGGAFFPVSVLPDWLEPIAAVVPTRFAFDGLRAALFQGGGWEADAVALVAIAVVSLPIALWLFRRALNYCRRTGSLVQY
jgi:ABC-2 type transport system permease protein